MGYVKHMNPKLLFALSLSLLILLSACVTQPPVESPDANAPQNEEPVQEQPTQQPNTQPSILPPIVDVSGEFTLVTGDTIDNLRGAGIYENKRLTLRVKSVVFRQFPLSKIAVFEVLDKSGAIITQRDARIGRYLNEDLVDQDTYEPVLLDKIYVKDIIVSESGNSVTIEINK